VVVVGAGPVAASKIKSVLDTGAQVTVIAPEVVSELERPDLTLCAAPSVRPTSTGPGSSWPRLRRK
jgi:hypothetical protein